VAWSFGMLLKRLIAAALVLCFSSLTVVGGGAKDADATQGSWRAAAAELGGKEFPEKVRESIKLVIKDNTYTVTIGKVVDKGTVKVNSSAKPKEFDIIGTEGPNKDKTILAIYEVDGDTMRVCYDLGLTGRPKEFKTAGEAKHFLVTYKREQK